VNKNVNPLIALVVILLALGAIWYCYSYVFHGKQAGFQGPPSSVKMTPPPPGLAPPGAAPGQPKSSAPGQPKDGPPGPAKQ
jgi:hypothetical protein